MDLVHGFVMLLRALSPTITAPTFESFVTGWVLSGSGTITRSILSAGDLATKHILALLPAVQCFAAVAQYNRACRL
ncbi:MAG: hypothetical protein WCQ77_13530 [Planctomycetota bacterium]